MAVNVTSGGALFFAAGIDLSGFDRDAAKMVATFEEIKLKVANLDKAMRLAPSLDTAAALKQINQIEFALAKATSVGFDTSKLYKQIDELRTFVTSAPVSVPVSLKVQPIDNFAFEALKGKVAKLSNELHLNPTLDSAAVLGEIKKIEAELKQATRFGFDTAPIYQELNAVRAKVLAAPIEVPAKLQIDTSDFSEIEKLKVRVAALSDSLRINPKIDTTGALAEIKEIEAALKTATTAGFDTGRLYTQVNELRAKVGAAPIEIPAQLKIEANDFSEIEKLKVRVAALSDTLRISPKIDAGAAIAEVKEIETALNAATAKGFDTGRLYQQLEGIKAKVSATPLPLTLTIASGDTAAFDKLKLEVATLSNDLRIKPQIDTSAALVQIEGLEAALKTATTAGFNTTELTAQLATVREKIAAQPIVIPVTANTTQAIESIEALRARLSIKQAEIIQTTDLSKIALLNREVELLETQIAQTSNAGKIGFDEVGRSVTTTANKTNLLSKGFSLVRQAAFLIPGIGIAGIFDLATTAIIALAKSLFTGEKAFDSIREKIKLYNDVLKDSNKAAASQLVDAKILYQVAKDTSASMTDRLNAVKALKLEFPEYFKGISNEAILNGTAKKSYDELAKSILATSRARAGKAKLDEIEDKRLDRDIERQKIINATNNEKNAVQRVSGKNFAGTQALSDKSIEEKYQYDLNVIEQRRKKALEKLEKEDKQDNERESYIMKFAGGVEQVAKVIEKTDGVFKKEKEHHETVNALIAKRVTLTEQVEALHTSASRSGLTKEASALDEINSRYDKVLRSAIRFNAEVDKAPTARKVEKQSIADIEHTRSIELANTQLKQESESYIKNLDVQKSAFQKYQDAVTSIGKEGAVNLYTEQRKGFDSYLQYLKSEFSKLAFKVAFGVSNIGDILKLRALSKEISDQTASIATNEEKIFIAAYKAAATLDQRLKKVNADFAAQREAIIKNYTGADREAMLANLEADRQKSIDAAKDEVFQKSKLYRDLNTEIIKYSRESVKAQIKGIEETLKHFKDINPEIKKRLEGSLKDLKGVLSGGVGSDYEQKLVERKNELEQSLATQQLSTEEYKKQLVELGKIKTEIKNLPLNDVAEKADMVASALSSIGDAVKPINEKLGTQLSGLSDTLTLGADAVRAMSGDATAIVKLVTDLITSFAKVRQSAIDAKAGIAEFQTAQQTAEIDFSIGYRERIRQQEQLNALKIKGIEEENRLLDQQRKDNQTDYQKVLSQIAQESYISSETAKKTKGSFLGGVVGFFGGTRTNIVKEYASLLGKDYDALLKLYNSGALEGKAKSLFETLQKLKDESGSISSAIDELNDKASQLFTGTTADSIAGGILQGLKEGKRGIADFAGTFESTMQDSFDSIFEEKAIRERMSEFYKQLAEAARSGGGVDSNELVNLKTLYGKYIDDISKEYQALGEVTGASNRLNGAASANNLPNSISKNITEDTANILAGKFNAFQLTALDQLNVAKIGLVAQQETAANTAATVNRMDRLLSKFDAYETGLKRLHVDTA